MQGARILVVDDEPDIVELVAMYLADAGYEVLRADTGTEALRLVAEARPDLVLLDLMLPEVDGWEVCRRLRAEGALPVIMLTARGDPVDAVRGLDLGADDYLVKPFYGLELVARVRAVLRRSEYSRSDPEGRLSLGDLRIDPARRTVAIGGEPILLRAREFDLLLYLARNEGIVLTRGQLLDNVWGYDFLGDSRTVDVHVAHVRSHLAPSRQVGIETIWGVGYKLVVKASAGEAAAAAPA